MSFLEPERIITPLGTSNPLDLRTVLGVEAVISKYRAAVLATDWRGAARFILEIVETSGLDYSEASVGDILASFILILNGVWSALQDMPPAIANTGKGSKPEVYDYPERGQYLWVDMIAATYHWTRTEILALHPREAARYVQEIERREFAIREWQHSLSELAYDHKSGKYKPLQKPLWMTTETGKIKEMREGPKTILIPRSFLPQGPVISLDEMMLNVSPQD